MRSKLAGQRETEDQRHCRRGEGVTRGSWRSPPGSRPGPGSRSTPSGPARRSSGPAPDQVDTLLLEVVDPEVQRVVGEEAEVAAARLRPPGVRLELVAQLVEIDL